MASASGSRAAEADVRPGGARAGETQAARREIAELVAGMNRAIDTWDGPAYVAPLAKSRSMIFLGSDVTELSLGYDAIAPDILESFARARAGGRGGSAYAHGEVRTGATSDGSVGWWVQSMTYRFERDGERREHPFRISGFALRGADGWKIALAHAALPVDADLLRRLERPGDPPEAIPDPAAGDGPMEGKRSRAAVAVEKSLRELVRELAARYNRHDKRGWSDLFAADPDVQVIGVGPSAIREGPPDESLPFALAPFGREGARFESDSVVVRVLTTLDKSPDVGWWYESGRLVTRTAGSRRRSASKANPAATSVLPVRSTGGALRVNGAWRILQWHVDVPVPNDSTVSFSRRAGR
ncbi:MAG: nuclear transport factor 2 family protein [Gemmatimonadetes bacterium]|nr:nuclear transport factor 2 family protein [Gemmatimonadota bacterium]